MTSLRAPQTLIPSSHALTYRELQPYASYMARFLGCPPILPQGPPLKRSWYAVARFMIENWASVVLFFAAKPRSAIMYDSLIGALCSMTGKVVLRTSLTCR